MKYYISIFLIAGFFFVGAYSKSELSKTDNVNSKLDELNDKHGNLLYVAFFSVEETRPFSINQFDKTLDLYGKTFTSGKKYLSTLNKNDFRILKKHISNYIIDKDDGLQEEIFDKLNYWCIVKKEFDLIQIEYKISSALMLQALYDNSSTRQSFDEIIKLGPFDINELSENQAEEIFNNVINHLATQPKKEQFQYYSYLFNTLATNL